MDEDISIDELPSGDAAFHATLPTTHVAAGWLFRDEDGRVLLVKPTYKAPWEIPGGVVESGESPRGACRRELREELGVDMEPGALLCVDWRPPVGAVRGDALRFVFDGGVITKEDAAQFIVDHRELRGWEMVQPDHLDDHVKPVLARRIRQCLDRESPVYLEDGRPIS